MKKMTKTEIFKKYWKPILIVAVIFWIYDAVSGDPEPKQLYFTEKADKLYEPIKNASPANFKEIPKAFDALEQLINNTTRQDLRDIDMYKFEFIDSIVKNRKQVFEDVMYKIVVKSYFGGINKESYQNNEFISNNLNNPSSYEHVETFFEPHKKDGYFQIKTIFRAKNAFNATITSEAWYKLDFNGNYFDLKIK